MNNLPSGIAIGGITGLAVVLGDVLAGSQVSGATIKDVLPVVCTVAAAVWWAGRKFQKIEDGLDELKAVKSEMAEIKKHIATCPLPKPPTTHHY